MGKTKQTPRTGKPTTPAERRAQYDENRRMAEESEAEADKRSSSLESICRPKRKKKVPKSSTIVDSDSSSDDTAPLSDDEINSGSRQSRPAARGRRKVQTGSGSIVGRRQHGASPPDHVFHCIHPGCLNTGTQGNLNKHIRTMHKQYDDKTFQLKRVDPEVLLELEARRQLIVELLLYVGPLIQVYPEGSSRRSVKTNKSTFISGWTEELLETKRMTVL